MPPRRYRQVVAIFEQGRVGGFDKQFQPARRIRFVGKAFARAGNIPHDLAQPGGAARRAGEIDFAGARRLVDALTARKLYRAPCPSAHPQIIAGALDILHVNPAHSARCAWRELRAVPVAGVVLQVAIQECERLQAATTRQCARLLRQEAVEQAVVTVFGQIDDAGPGIDTSRLVAKPAHGFQRFWLHQSLMRRRYLENPAVTLRGVWCGHGVFLTCEPAAPGRGAACAVGGGSGQGQKLLFHAPGCQVHDQRGGAAGKHQPLLAAPEMRQLQQPFVQRT